MMVKSSLYDTTFIEPWWLFSMGTAFPYADTTKIASVIVIFLNMLPSTTFKFKIE
jgi:hypothetical protein